jgi:hypothetical protein
MRRVCSLLCLGLLMLGVVAAAETPRTREDEEQECRTSTQRTPAPGSWVEVLPGEALLATEMREECLWARLRADARVSEAGALIKKGTLLWNAGEGRYCHRETATRFCVQDKDANGTFDRSTTMGGGKGVTLTTPYEEIWVPTGTGPGDRRKELVLLEVAPDRLRATLRDNCTSNEVSYALEKEGWVSVGEFRGQVRRSDTGVEVRVQ